MRNRMLPVLGLSIVTFAMSVAAQRPPAAPRALAPGRRRPGARPRQPAAASQETGVGTGAEDGRARRGEHRAAG